MTVRAPLLVVYLLATSAAAFAVPIAVRPYVVVGLILYQIGLLAVAQQLSRRAFAAIWRLKFLFLFLLLCYTLLPGTPTDDYVYPFGGWFGLNLTGLAASLVMVGQLSLIVLVSYVVRVLAPPEAFVQGLLHFRVSPLFAHSLDATLAMLGDAPGSGCGGGGGQGRGMGGGRGRRREEASVPDAADVPRSTMLRSQVHTLSRRIQDSLQQAQDRAARLGLDERRAHDVGVIAGIAFVMMSFKLVKILPGLPFASGYKAVIFIPLYIIAADRTSTRYGATIAGTIMGLIGFLNGDGRYGVFEILKHMVPGAGIDLLWPLVRRWRHSLFVLTLLGLVAAMARTSTELVLVLCMNVRWEVYSFPAAKLVPNLTAGFLSGFVTHLLLSSLPSEKPVGEPPMANAEGALREVATSLPAGGKEGSLHEQPFPAPPC